MCQILYVCGISILCVEFAVWVEFMCEQNIICVQNIICAENYVCGTFLSVCGQSCFFLWIRHRSACSLDCFNSLANDDIGTPAHLVDVMICDEMKLLLQLLPVNETWIAGKIHFCILYWKARWSQSAGVSALSESKLSRAWIAQLTIPS